jgi:hypothetical protein
MRNRTMINGDVDVFKNYTVLSKVSLKEKSNSVKRREF